MDKISISVVDDHKLFRNGIVDLISRFQEYEVISQSGNGKEFIQSLQSGIVPAMAILDIQMPEMDGEATARWLQQNHPQMKILALTMMDDERNILRMLKAGARGYVLKSAEPDEFKLALDQIWHRNFYHSEMVSNVLVKNMGGAEVDVKKTPRFSFPPNELEFLQLICTELTYKEIAERMKVSVRTIDGYREDFFSRFNLKSRVGLVMFAIKNDLVKIKT
jgi:two-component system, NarL family, invasion response regulator UvrY